MPVRDRIPTELIQSILREYLADPSVRLTEVGAEPLPSDGYSGNQLLRLHLTWIGEQPTAGPSAATYVLKRWLPGGHGVRLLGVERPLEALAWRAGLLRSGALPAGVFTPIVGARLDPGGRSAWILLEDVSTALVQYSREAPLPPSKAVARARLVLDRMARLHARWERPEQQAILNRCSWLVPMERVAWCEAASYAAVLGKPLRAGMAPGSPVTDELRADVAAFLAWLPAGDRPLFEELLCRRQPLAAALSLFPHTLLHGDLDDRNIGLLRAHARAADEQAPILPELVLIDWEWMGRGASALDVTRVCATFPAVCDPTLPCPEAAFSGELFEFYFDCYRAHGGALTDRRAWRRSCALALLANAMSQVRFFGSMVRHDVKPVVATLARQFDMITEAARSLRLV